MTDTSKKPLPNIPVSHWLSLRSQFKKSIPGTITTNYLASVLVMTEISARNNIVPTLRILGLIDSEGKINQDMAKKFRDDETYPDLCRSIIKTTYPQELQDAFPDKNSNRDRVKSWFMNYSGQGDSGASKMAAFYLALVAADLTTVNGTPTKPGNGKKEARPKPIVQKKDSTQAGKSEHSHNSGGSLREPANHGPQLNINIQIHISSDASADQIQSISENMAKYVYKN